MINAINGNSALQAADGVVADDLRFSTTIIQRSAYAQFNLYARTAGWPASQILAAFTGSTDLVLTPTNTQSLDQNVNDLQPRNHLYLTAGVTNLSLTFPLDTTALADGSHELTAVVYEGSHVRTQARVTQNVRIQNTPLNATFTTLAGASNTVLNFTLLFSVAANTNTISTIELFTTGGSVGVVSNLVLRHVRGGGDESGDWIASVLRRGDAQRRQTISHRDEVDSHRRVGTAVWADA